MEIAVPEGCTLVEITFRADTEEAFDAAVETLELHGVGDISNTAMNGKSAYRYRHASGSTDGRHVTLRGPKYEMKLVPVDA